VHTRTGKEIWVSVHVPDLPVYATADSPGATERAIREVLTAYLDEHPELPASRTTVKVARVATTRGERVVTIVATDVRQGTRSRRKSAASYGHAIRAPRRAPKRR
jgi:hypothetical protein